MYLQWQRWLAVLSVMSMLLVLWGCGTAGNVSGSTGAAPVAPASSKASSPVAIASPEPPLTNTISFNLTGAVKGTYAIISTDLISMLRHGHREFTIEVANDGKSMIMAFYGYHGPDTYTLDGVVNGGDVRIDLGSASLPGQKTGANAWELPQKQAFSCTLTVSRDAPTPYAGIDKMTGNFSCPSLTSTNPALQQSVALDQGHFDLFILVVS